MKYNCINCNKGFDKKSNYECHMRRKTPCVKILTSFNHQIIDMNVEQKYPTPKTHQIGVLAHQNNTKKVDEKLSQTHLQNKLLQNNIKLEQIKKKTYTCEYCNHELSRIDALTRHIQNRCKVKKIKDIQYNELTQKISEQNEVINNLTEKIQILEDNTLSTSIIVSKAKIGKRRMIKSELIKSNTNTNSNNITNTNSNNLTNLTNSNNLTNTNIIFNGTVNFGNETTEKLTEKEIIQTLTSRSSAFTNFIKLMHINDNIPEQQNILINNLRSNKALIYEDDKLMIKNRKEVISELISMRTSDLEELLNENYQNKKITKKDFEIITNIIDFLKYSYFETEDVDGNIIKADSDMIKSLRKHYEDIILLFYNSREIISKNINSNTTSNQKKPKEETQISEYF